MNLALKKAFIASCAPRINLVLEKEYWDYIIDETEDVLKYKSMYNFFCTFINEHFDGDVSLYYTELFKFKRMCGYTFKGLKQEDCIVDEKMFNAELFKYKKEMESDGYVSEIKNGKYYISIDLKDSGFQCLGYFGFLNGLHYIDFFKTKTKHIDLIKFKGNKYDLFRDINNIIEEKYLEDMSLALLSKIYESDNKVITYIKKNSLKLVRINNDELLFEIGDTFNLPDYIIEEIQDDVQIDGIDCHIKVLQYNLIHYLYNGHECYKTIYTSPFSKEIKFSARNCLYIWQLYKLYKGEELTEKDLVQYINGKIVPFTDEIKILRD